MLPDIKAPSGIRKTVQIAFGGIDLRPDAADGTFAKTDNMTSDKFPLLASRPARRAAYTEGSVSGCDLYGMGDGLFYNIDGHIYYNDVYLGHAVEQGGGNLIPFGNKIIIPWTREMIDLTYRPKGLLHNTAELPQDADEGDAYIIQQYSPSIWYHCYVYESGSWVDKGPIWSSLEKEISDWPMIFRDGSYQGEDAAANTIEMNPNNWYLPGVTSVPAFTDYFKAGDSVTISGCSGMPENNMTLIVREVGERELRFYENSFHNYVGRHTVGKDGLDPDLYECTGWFREDRGASGTDPVKKYFVLPSGTSMVQGDYIEYRFDNNVLNPAGLNYNAAEIRLFKKDGTEYAASPLTPVNSYNSGTYPDGPVKISFESVEAKNLYHGEYSVTIKKKWPEGIQGVFADSNRLWGWVGHQIRASKLGDPSNWEFFDGTSEDSWAVDVQDPDEFTGGISVHGYPTFFTENKRYRVYGAQPSSYQISTQDCNGVKAGCAKSMASFDGALYYVSRIGVMQDTGAIPGCVSEALGPLRLSDAVGGGHQRRYYVTGTDRNGVRHNLVLDTGKGVWIDEGSRKIDSYAAAGGIMHEALLTGTGNHTLLIQAYGTGSPLGNGTEEGTISSEVVTNDYTMAQPNRKRVHRVQLRFVIDAGASLAVSIMYDGNGDWRSIRTIQGDGNKKSVYLPVLPRRCDHFRLKFTGSGDWVLHSLALDLRQGSAIF